MEGRGVDRRVIVRPADLEGAARLLTSVSDPRVRTCLAASWILRADIAALFEPRKTTHAALEFVDIAGLVRGASKGEGLGNQFLANIREVDAIAHVLRCFSDPDVVHVDGPVDPARDRDVVETELMLKDLETLEKKRERRAKDAKAPGEPGDEAKADLAVYDTLKAALEAGRPARAVVLSDDERPRVRDLFLLTAKPVRSCYRSFSPASAIHTRVLGSPPSGATTWIGVSSSDVKFARI